jgi:hypothetical protein
MNTTQLISSIKRKTSMPTSQGLWTDSRIVESINEELQISMVPLMMRIQEDHFTAYEAYATFTREIPIPPKAIGSKIKSIGFYTEGYLSRPIPRMDEENSFLNRNLGFVFEKYSIKFMFDQFPQTNQEIRVYYYKRPNSLAEGALVTNIDSVDPLTNTIVVTSATSWMVAGAKIDVQSIANPFSMVAEDITIVSITGTSLVLSSVEGLTAGDSVAEAGYCFYPNVPVELHSLLAQRVAVKVLEANGSQQEMAAAQGIYNQMEKDAIYILTPRADGTTAKFTPGRGISSYV